MPDLMVDHESIVQSAVNMSINMKYSNNLSNL